MKIVALINQNNGGGAQHALLRVCGMLEDAGFEVELWCLQQVKNGIAAEKANFLVRADERVTFGAHLLALSRLWNVLRTRRPDGVLAFLPFSCAAGLTVAWLSGVKIRVASQRNPASSYSRLMYWADLLAGSLGIYTKNVMNSYATAHSFDRHPGTYTARSAIIYNGVESHIAACDDHPRISLPSGKPLLVNIGRLSPQKNQSFLVAVTSRLPDVHLALVGGGPIEPDLRAQASALGIEHRVHFLGHVDRSTVRQLIRRATIVVQPSHYEGQSNAVLEALVEGATIVASNIDTHVETLALSNGQHAGILLPGDDIEAWKRELDVLIRNESARARLSAFARLRAKDFTVQRMGDEFASLLRSEIQRVGLGEMKRASE